MTFFWCFSWSVFVSLVGCNLVVVLYRLLKNFLFINNDLCLSFGRVCHYWHSLLGSFSWIYRPNPLPWFVLLFLSNWCNHNHIIHTHVVLIRWSAELLQVWVFHGVVDRPEVLYALVFGSRLYWSYNFVDFCCFCFLLSVLWSSNSLFMSFMFFRSLYLFSLTFFFRPAIVFNIISALSCLGMGGYNVYEVIAKAQNQDDSWYVPLTLIGVPLLSAFLFLFLTLSSVCTRTIVRKNQKFFDL